MADNYDKLKKEMESDFRNGSGRQQAQGNLAVAIERLVDPQLPDAAVHRESHSEMERADK